MKTTGSSDGSVPGKKRNDTTPPSNSALPRDPGSSGSPDGRRLRRRNVLSALTAAAQAKNTGTPNDATTGDGRRRVTQATVAADTSTASIPAGAPTAGTVDRVQPKSELAPVHRLLVGPEPLRRHLRGERDHLLVDAAEDDPAQAVLGAGLFTSSVRIVRAETLDVQGAERLARALDAVALPVLIEAEKLSVAVEKRLAAACVVTKLSLERDGRKTLAKLAERLGLRLEHGVESLLLEQLGHDPGRLVGTLEALAAGGFDRPSAAQVRLLAGSSRAESLPWTLLERIETGADVGDLLERLDPIPAIAFLSKRVRLAAHAAENPGMKRENVQPSFGNVSESAWRQAKRLANLIDERRRGTLIEQLAAADVHAKRGRGRAALALAAGAVRHAIAAGTETP